MNIYLLKREKSFVLYMLSLRTKNPPPFVSRGERIQITVLSQVILSLVPFVVCYPQKML